MRTPGARTRGGWWENKKKSDFAILVSTSPRGLYSAPVAPELLLRGLFALHADARETRRVASFCSSAMRVLMHRYARPIAHHWNDRNATRVVGVIGTPYRSAGAMQSRWTYRSLRPRRDMLPLDERTVIISEMHLAAPHYRSRQKRVV